MLCITAAGKHKKMQAPLSKFYNTLFGFVPYATEGRCSGNKNTGGGPCLPLRYTECTFEFLNISHSASLWSRGIALAKLTTDESTHFGNRKRITSLRKESSNCLWQIFFYLNHTRLSHYKSDFVHRAVT